jgi:hypothetical protein
MWQVAGNVATGSPEYCLRCDATVSRLGRILVGASLGASLGAAQSAALAVALGVAALLTTPITAGQAATTAVPACATRSLVVTVSSNGAGGKELIYVGLRNRGGRMCSTGGRVTLALRDATTHALLHVYGNPYVRVVRRTLRRGANTLVTLQWQNYCGPERPLLVVATFGRRRAVEHDSNPGARCELPDVHSQLLLVHLPR